jgi:predicted membrane protein
MSDLTIDVGAADLLVVHLANANADQIRVHGGIGVADLDFSGTWSRDVTVDAKLVVGKLVLRVPSDVGVRLDVQRVLAGFDHEGMVKRDGVWYSTNYDAAPHKLRVHAETFFGLIELQRGAH